MRPQVCLFAGVGAVWVLLTLRALSPYLIMRPPMFMDQTHFHPVHTTRLASGGELYRMNECTPEQRPYLSLHGNGKSVGDFEIHYNQLIDRGYCVYTLEYSYYLARMPRVPRITEFQNDVIAAVANINRRELIVFGASLGGSVLASVVHKFDPKPSQIGFIGAFANVTDLAESILPYSSYLLSFDYGIERPSRYWGEVVIVHAKDDFIVPVQNAYDLCDAFAECDHDDVEIVEGWKHVATCLQHFDQWKDLIMSAWLWPESVSSSIPDPVGFLYVGDDTLESTNRPLFHFPFIDTIKSSYRPGATYTYVDRNGIGRPLTITYSSVYQMNTVELAGQLPPEKDDSI